MMVVHVFFIVLALFLTLAQAAENVVTNYAKGVGGWGGSCTCPDGSVYWVGDYIDACVSLACVGGVSGLCNPFNAQWSYRKVECQDISGHANITTTTTTTVSSAVPWQLFAQDACCDNWRTIRIETTWQPSLDACGQRCISMSACQGFAYATHRGRTDACYLWNAPCQPGRGLCAFNDYVLLPNATTLTTTSTAVPWQLLETNKCCSNFANVRLDVTLNPTWEVSPDACGQRCASTTSCWGFLYDAPKLGYNCWLQKAPCQPHGHCSYNEYVMLQSLTVTTTTNTTSTTTTTISTSTTNTTTTTTSTTTIMDVPENACIKLSFDFFSSTTRCSYDDVIAEMENILDVLKGDSQECAHDAVTELNLHLGVNGSVNAVQKAQRKVENVCKMQKVDHLRWEKITHAGKDFDKAYFSGVGPWNLQVEATHYGKQIHNLRDDVRTVRDLYASYAKTARIGWPDFVESLSHCSLRAVTCCMIGDRQANDNNGNCAKPYDTNCVNSVPADNSHVCSVNGSAPKLDFVGDEQTPVHCHSFAWSSQELDASSVFRGNALFYTSLYDHLAQRGYVKNIPGAPMCGCVETMPVVDRSDCTQVDVETKFRFSPSRAGPSISGPKVDIKFHTCQSGKWNQNNNLYFHYKQLVLEGKASLEELIKLRKFVRTSKNYRRPNIHTVTSYCNDDNGYDEIQAMLAENSEDAELLKMAIVNYFVEHGPAGTPAGGFYVHINDVRDLAQTFLGEKTGLDSDALSDYVHQHLYRDVYTITGSRSYLIKLSLLPALMRELASHSRRLVIV